jgi:5-methylcytosine-specific restriction endonuclease McrA
MSVKQHIIRICSLFPNIAAAVRPLGGRLTVEQIEKMVRYIEANPIEGVSILIPKPSVENQHLPIQKIPRVNKKLAKRIREKAKEAAQADIDNFYHSWDWSQLRYKALQAYGRSCQCCGASQGDVTPQGNKVRIVVDHIRPVRKHWNLRLEISNLQILCNECNMGKASHDETDYRPKPASTG